jgi:hypothetical protein
MHLLLIGCEVIVRELSSALARAAHQVDARYLSKGLHDRGAKAMRLAIQAEIDAADSGPWDAIALGYGLCGNGLEGIIARSKPLVLPRAHDCIGLLMGDRAAFSRHFQVHPGTYYRSAGWVERGAQLEPLARERTGAGYTREALIEKYGPDDGEYLYQELSRYKQNYRRLTYIATGLAVDSAFAERARQEAADRGWSFEIFPGNLRLFEQLLDADWNPADFLVVPPGCRVRASHSDQVIAIEPQVATQ